MRAHVHFVVDGLDLRVAFDCTEQEAYALHQHIIDRASKSKESPANVVGVAGGQGTANIAMPKLPPFNESMLMACPDELPGVIDGNAVLRGARAMYVYLERQLSA